MTDREKIIKIIEKWAERTITTRVWGAGVHDPYNAAELADALIADEIGDVSEWKRRAEAAEQNATAWKDCANKWQKYYKEQAAREIEKERRDD